MSESDVEGNSERENLIRICLYIAFLVGAAGVQEAGEETPAPETLKSRRGSLAPRNLAKLNKLFSSSDASSLPRSVKQQDKIACHMEIICVKCQPGIRALLSCRFRQGMSRAIFGRCH